jgi:tryptophan-rich sensory protein
MFGIKTIEDYFYLLLPMISGYTVASFCGPSKSAGASVKFRPPSWVFGIVWPILYLLIGLAWVNSKKYTLYFFILIILLNLWLVTYVCQKNKQGGVYVLLCSLLCTLFIYTGVEKFSKYLITPLMVWLLFALLLNTYEVQM